MEVYEMTASVSRTTTVWTPRYYGHLTIWTHFVWSRDVSNAFKDTLVFWAPGVSPKGVHDNEVLLDFPIPTTEGRAIWELL